MRRGRWFPGSALYRSLSLLSNGGDPGARNGKPFARRDFRSFSARVFCAYKQPSRGRRTGPPNACEEEKKVDILAAIRRAAQTGMGLEFLDIDPVSNTILLSWIENLRQFG